MYCISVVPFRSSSLLELWRYLDRNWTSLFPLRYSIFDTPTSFCYIKILILSRFTLSLCLSLSLSHHSHSLSLTLSPPPSLCLSLTHSLSHHSLSVSLCLSLFFSLSLSISVFPLLLYFCLSLHIFVHLHLSMCPSIYLPLSLNLSIAIYPLAATLFPSTTHTIYCCSLHNNTSKILFLTIALLSHLNWLSPREGLSPPLAYTPLSESWTDHLYYFSTLSFKRSGNYTISFLLEVSIPWQREEKESGSAPHNNWNFAFLPPFLSPFLPSSLPSFLLISLLFSFPILHYWFHYNLTHYDMTG